jgi:hypothetical protein
MAWFPDIGWRRALLLTVIALLLMLALAAVVALALAVEGAPRVGPRDDVAVADVDRAVALLRQHDPRRATTAQLRRLVVTERDLDLLASHAARRFGGAHARVALDGEGRRLKVLASLPLPAKRWLNVELRWRQAAGLPRLEHARAGALPLPPHWVGALARRFGEHQGLPADALLRALDDVEQVTIVPGRVVVAYRLGPQTLARLRGALVAPAQQQRLRHYASALDAAARAHGGFVVPLPPLLAPLLALAAERSAAGEDSADEHRAALLVLTLHATQRRLDALVPAAADAPWPPAQVLTLHGRHDFAQHFLISALVAAEAGSPLADAVGLWKEFDDLRPGGSGFSFADLAADRAGTRFGELALAAPQRLHERLPRGFTDAALMPDARDLPEFLTQAEFARRYGGVGQPAFERLRAQIEARLDALALYR